MTREGGRLCDLRPDTGKVRGRGVFERAPARLGSLRRVTLAAAFQRGRRATVSLVTREASLFDCLLVRRRGAGVLPGRRATHSDGRGGLPVLRVDGVALRAFERDHAIAVHIMAILTVHVGVGDDGRRVALGVRVTSEAVVRPLFRIRAEAVTHEAIGDALFSDAGSDAMAARIHVHHSVYDLRAGLVARHAGRGPGAVKAPVFLGLVARRAGEAELADVRLVARSEAVDRPRGLHELRRRGRRGGGS